MSLANDACVALGSTTKAPRRNRNTAAVTAALEEDYGTAQQIEELKISLTKVREEKQMAELKAQNDIQNQQKTVESELRRQQEELREMMESIRREKEEVRLQTALLAAEKEAIKEEAERKSISETNRFHEELDIMRSQNMMLVNRMERSEREAKDTLNRERTERMDAVSKIEQENQKLIQQLTEAQQKVN